MNIILIKDAKRIEEASAIALESHIILSRANPWLPTRALEDFIPRIEWMTQEGTVYGLESEGSLRAFLGWFKLEDFRNLGPGALTPDWCLGVRAGADAREVSKLISPLFRRLLEDVKLAGIPVHAVGVPATESTLLDECSMLGYGRIVLDAARPAADLLDGIGDCPREFSARENSSRNSSPRDISPRGSHLRIRAATQADAFKLAELDARLARHVGESPVLMPDAHGSTSDEWEQWLRDPETVTFVAERAEKPVHDESRLAETDFPDATWKPVGFIKADGPHMDVSWFVHGDLTLAICGLYVDPTCRGMNVGARLVRAIAANAAARGKRLVSVDCETHNPEARAFWTSRFMPVSWSFERRF